MTETCSSQHSSLHTYRDALAPQQGTHENMADTENWRSYTGTAKTLHWVILALMIAQFIFAWTMPAIRRDTPVTTLISLHFTFGMIILAVAVVRLGWRLTHGEPAPEDGMPPWQQQSARAVHWLLYVLLFVVPILGWINASYRGMPIVMFGLELPTLITKGAPGCALDRRRPWIDGGLCDAGAGRRACRGRALSSFHSRRSRACSECYRALTRNAGPRSGRDWPPCVPDSNRRKFRPQRKTGSRRRLP